MEKKFKYICILTVLFLSVDVISQSIDLDQLTKIGQSIGGTYNSSEGIESDVIEDQSQSTNKEGPKEKPLEDRAFGYQGRSDSFVSKPQPKSKSKLDFFGYDFFEGSPSTYPSSKQFSVPENYIIGQGDVVKISLYGNRNSRYELQVSADGDIFIPGIGPVSAAGLTFDSLKSVITKTLSAQYIGTLANVTLGKLRSINIFILGNAVNPGMYTVSALTTMTNAIFINGGIRKTGSLRNIQLKRNGEIISTMDFYDLLLKGDTRNDKSLKEGDVVFIPSVTKTVAITGEVLKPAIYELLENEKLSDLIQFAGNLKPEADLNSIEIERVDSTNNSFKLLDINLNRKASKNANLENGDLVNVYPVNATMRNAILITGHAQQPGFMSWEEGLRVSDIISSFDSLLPMTDLNYTIVKRELSDGIFNIFQVDIEKLLKDLNDNKNSSQNILLRERDEIVFFPKFLSLDLVSTELIENDELSQSQRQSLLEQYQKKQTEINPVTGLPISNINSKSNEPVPAENIDNNIFYRYNVYHYCTLPENVGQEIVESGGIASVASLSETQTASLEDIRSAQVLEGSKTQSQELSLTDVCRQQLINPILNLIKRQSTSIEMKKVISIYGNVFFPGEYPLSENMTLEDAIKSGGGLKDSTYTTDIELIRSDLDGKEYKISNTNASTLDTRMMSSSLRPNDLVNIKKISREVSNVQILGEVFFPGTFPISKNETLRSLIMRAGSFNNKAFPKAAVFQRQSLAASELKRFNKAQAEIKRKILLASQTKGVGQETFNPEVLNQLDILLQSGNTSLSLGRIVVDIQAIVDGTSEDIILEDGDTLFIPKAQNTVSVIGEVFVTNAHSFEDNLTLTDYINLSGGTTNFADQENTYIIKSDGSIIPPSRTRSSGFFRSNYSAKNSLSPGDTIVVPLKVDTFSGIRATTEVTQVIYQLAVAAAAVSSFK
jgi:polysaccharide export outer membrane protein